MLYVYAITESPARPHGLGLRSARLRVIGDEPPFAVVSDHDQSVEPGEEDLWAHERVVEDAMKMGAVLPFRFGTSVPDEARLTGVLEERRRELEVALRRVRGAVELGVRAHLRPRVRSNGDRLGERVPGPGTGYMLGRLADERQVADLIARIHEPLATLARRSARRPSSAGSGAFKAAYLVDRDRIEPFRRRVDELAEDVEGASVVCTGPWPPYSFTSGQEG